MIKPMDHLFRRHVEKHDPAMFKIIVDHPVLTLPNRRPAFEAIVRTVAGQQLSTKAAAKICSRLEMALGGQISPQSTLKLTLQLCSWLDSAMPRHAPSFQLLNSQGTKANIWNACLWSPGTRFGLPSCPSRELVLECGHVRHVWSWFDRRLFERRFGASNSNGKAPAHSSKTKTRGLRPTGFVVESIQDLGEFASMAFIEAFRGTIQMIP